jgi:hypothetical protein
MILHLRPVAALCVAAATAVAAEPWQVVTVNRVSVEGTLKNGAEFEVRIECQQPSETTSTYFGAQGQPRSVISDITIKLNGKKVSVPETGFRDLANPLLQTVSITGQSTGDLKLRFTGGDGDLSYEAEYVIQSGHLTQRTISYFEAGAQGERSRVVKTTNF